MGLSLKELKEQLIAKQGYTITPAHNQLNDLKILVDDMMGVRNESPPSSGSGYYNGTNCSGHNVPSGYKLSLGDINSLDIKGCSCHTVNDTTAYCRSRTYYCSCNSNIPTCTCNSRTPPVCDCQSRTAGKSCACHTVSCSCYSNLPYCISYVPGDCMAVQSPPPCTCNSRTPPVCNCQSRTSSCGSRNTTSCTCNGRCACNAEKRFD